MCRTHGLSSQSARKYASVLAVLCPLSNDEDAGVGDESQKVRIKNRDAPSPFNTRSRTGDQHVSIGHRLDTSSSRPNPQDGVVHLHLVVPRSTVSPPREPLPPQYERCTRCEEHVVDTGQVRTPGDERRHMLASGRSPGLHVGGGRAPLHRSSPPRLGIGLMKREG